MLFTVGRIHVNVFMLLLWQPLHQNMLNGNGLDWKILTWSESCLFKNGLLWPPFLLLLFRELIQNGLLYECSSDPREVHWLLPSPWAHVRPLVINCPPGWPHAAFCQCGHESGTLSIWFFCIRLLFFWYICCFKTLRRQYLTNLLICPFFLLVQANLP